MAITVYRELRRPNGPDAARGRWHSVALVLLTCGATAVFLDRADDHSAFATRLGVLAISAGFIIDLVLYLRNLASRQPR